MNLNNDQPITKRSGDHKIARLVQSFSSIVNGCVTLYFRFWARTTATTIANSSVGHHIFYFLSRNRASLYFPFEREQVTQKYDLAVALPRVTFSMFGGRT